MINRNLDEALKRLKQSIEGDLFIDTKHIIMYATDASAYREKPMAVVLPKTEQDIITLVQFADKHGVSLIPRAAGTSLAGQVVGGGIVVDISRYMTNVLEFNKEKRSVKVQPGVVLDELNLFLKDHGLFFGPETSTSNRCMIGGMVGNNACGSHSIIYGSTRDHLLEVRAVLSDGSVAVFGETTQEEFARKRNGNSLEHIIYNKTFDLLSPPEVLQEIEDQYPEASLRRRNTGYAIDVLSKSQPFGKSDTPFNFCNLIAGSEGTLVFATEITLNLVPLPPKEKGLICAHFKTLEEAIDANLIALTHKPWAVELIDDVILECTKTSQEQTRNRFFIQGDPGAVLVIEFACETKEELLVLRDTIERDMKAAGLGFHFPLITGTDINKVWALRKAGLGLLSNIPGEAKAVSVIEDTAVHPKYLSAYIADFKEILKGYGLSCVYHAHIATGELHMRPVLNLKEPKEVEIFRKLALDIAHLVKKYKGSLSGEHGDGRLRGEFIPVMVGEKNYKLLKEIKNIWDPHNIFNRNKIVDTPPMNTSLRYQTGRSQKLNTYFHFPEQGGIMEHVERCNGSADCRKSAVIGGVMCPTYMATRDEQNVTRARANVLRDFLINSTKDNPFDHKEIYEILDLCISCKGCKAECPANVDMAKLKAEFLQHYYDAHGVPLRSWLIAHITEFNKLGSLVPPIYNFFISNIITASLFKGSIGFALKRAVPKLYKTTLRKWARKHLDALNASLPQSSPEFILFIDEFTDYNDTEIGIKAIKLFNRLGYRVLITDHLDSGRTYISKGLIRKAKKIANRNFELLKDIVGKERPLLGIEPSAILSFKDEYPDLVDLTRRNDMIDLSKNVYLFDEFIANEINAGRIKKDLFTNVNNKIKLHGHCQQKSVITTKDTIKALTLPENYTITEVRSGCCGMAGSFGYEKEHYELSNKIGEMVLFPEVRSADKGTIIAAPGTSCRHHILEGTGVKALHPLEILYNALK